MTQGHRKSDHWLLVINLLAIIAGLIGLALITPLLSKKLEDIIINVGSGLVGAALTILLLTWAEHRSSKEDTAEIGARLDELTRSTRSLAFAEIVAGTDALYAKAENIVRGTHEKNLMTTDFRMLPRFGPDVKHQQSYLRCIVEHLKRKQQQGSPIQWFRGVNATSEQEANVLKSQATNELAELLPSDLLKLKFFPVAPLNIDILVGEGAILLAFPGAEAQPRLGLAIWNSEVADALRDWYWHTIWSTRHLKACGQLPQWLGTMTPINVSTAQEMNRICDTVIKKIKESGEPRPEGGIDAPPEPNTKQQPALS